MSLYDKITHIDYLINTTGFTSLTDVFIYQLFNFHMLQAQKVDII